MIYLNALEQQVLPHEALPAAVRASLGKPLRRASTLSQLALVGALACIPADRRQLPSAMLWQSTHGSRQETRHLLDEVCNGTAEPLPYDFLATQPNIAAAQLHGFLPGLRSATYLPLDSEASASWSLLLTLALNWLAEERYAQVLCAHLDSQAEMASGYWLQLGNTAGEAPLATVRRATAPTANTLADTPDFPAHLADWLRNDQGTTLALQSPASPRLALEFARL